AHALHNTTRHEKIPFAGKVGDEAGDPATAPYRIIKPSVDRGVVGAFSLCRRSDPIPIKGISSRHAMPRASRGRFVLAPRTSSVRRLSEKSSRLLAPRTYVGPGKMPLRFSCRVRRLIIAIRIINS